MKSEKSKLRILEIFTPERQTGNLGERTAVNFLRKKGYKILEKNYVASNSEIDIIAFKENTTAFVEVKTRSMTSLGKIQDRPASSVTPEKQRKIIKAANHYARLHPSDSRLRLDIIEVYLEDRKLGKKVKEIKHLKGAFDLNTAYDRAYFYKHKKEGSNL